MLIDKRETISVALLSCVLWLWDLFMIWMTYKTHWLYIIRFSLPIKIGTMLAMHVQEKEGGISWSRIARFKFRQAE